MNPELQNLEQRLDLIEQKVNLMVHPNAYVFERPIKGGAKGLSIQGLFYLGIVAGNDFPTQSLPTGWTVSGAGTYIVTHNLGTSNYVVVATGYEIVGHDSYASITDQQNNTFKIETIANGGVNNCGFHFILIKIL